MNSNCAKCKLIKRPEKICSKEEMVKGERFKKRYCGRAVTTQTGFQKIL